MNKIYTLLLLSVAHLTNSYGQESFSFHLYFEDASVSKDTIVVGYDALGTSGVDAAFGEANTLSNSWTDDFQVEITDKMPKILQDEFNPEAESFRLKKQIIKEYCNQAWSYWDNIFIDVKNAVFPITITWDDVVVENECTVGSMIENYDETGLWDVGNFDHHLKNKAQLIFSQSSLTYTDDDDVVISSFWLKMGGSTLFVGVDDLDMEKPLSLSPMPFSDSFQLIGNVEESSIHLYDINGNEMEFALNGNVLSPVNCDAGVYFITFTTFDGKQYNLKTVKM